MLKRLINALTVPAVEPGNGSALSSAQGHPITINPQANTKNTYERNVMRVERLKAAMQKLEDKYQKGSREWKLLELELEKRRIAIRQYEIVNEDGGLS